jgi:hypothetical protein
VLSVLLFQGTCEKIGFPITPSPCRWRLVRAKVFPAPQVANGSESGQCVDIEEVADEQKPSWETEPELKLRTYPYMIFPLSLHKILWDYLIIGLVAFNVLELPMTIAFGSEACDVRSFSVCQLCALELWTLAVDIEVLLVLQSHVTCVPNSLVQGQSRTDPEGKFAPAVLDAETQAQCKGSVGGGFSIFMDVMFWLDILLTFRTGVIDNRQVCILKAQVPQVHVAHNCRF